MSFSSLSNKMKQGNFNDIDNYLKNVNNIFK